MGQEEFQASSLPACSLTIYLIPNGTPQGTSSHHSHSSVTELRSIKWPGLPLGLTIPVSCWHLNGTGMCGKVCCQGDGARGLQESLGSPGL